MNFTLKPAQRALLLILTAIGLTSSARADPPKGWYSGGGVGENFVRTETITKIGTPFGDQPGGNAKLRHGYALIGNVGWGLAHGLRVEGEAAYRRNTLYQATAGSLHDAGASGAEDKSSLMANLIYECDRPIWGMNPYFGVGAGYTWIKWKNVIIADPTEVVRFNETRCKFAYQGIIGVSFLKNLVPGMSLTAEYRIQGVDGDRTYHGRVERSRFGAFPTSATVRNSINQTVVAGIRFQLPTRSR